MGGVVTCHPCPAELGSSRDAYSPFQPTAWCWGPQLGLGGCALEPPFLCSPFWGAVRAETMRELHGQLLKYPNSLSEPQLFMI